MVNRGYVLFADNFYCSVPLFQYLISVGINAVGTVRENSSSFPHVMKNRQSWGKKLDKGTIRYISIVEKQNDVLFVKWVDRNVASVPSTYRSANNYDYCTRNTKVDGSHKKVKVLRPKCISDYNQDMNGVDLSDQMYHICIQFNIGARSYGKHYSFILLIFVLGMHTVHSIDQGHRATTSSFGCVVCGIPLCFGERNCFLLFHSPEFEQYRESYSRDH